MPVIRIKQHDKERIDFMKGYLKTTSFITQLLDEHEQPRPNPTLKKKVTHPLFKPMKEAYAEAWEKNNGFEYQWNGAIDATALNRLIKTLESISLEYDPLGFWQAILSNLPDFYRDKTINAINKNLNGIIADIKNRGNKTGQNQDGGKFDFRT